MFPRTMCLAQHHRGTKPDVPKLECHEQHPGASKATEHRQGKAHLQRAEKPEHMAVDDGSSQKGGSTLPTFSRTFALGAKTQSIRHDEEQLKGRVLGQAAGSWSSSRQVLKGISLHTPPNSYKTKGDTKFCPWFLG